MREKLKQVAQIKAPTVLSQHISSDGTIKWLFGVGAGDAVEAVFIPEEDRGTLCVSSQAGCAMGCRFCSTGHQGFSRNLKTGEIIGQLWFAERFLRQHLQRDERVISNVVMMGMGESTSPNKTACAFCTSAPTGYRARCASTVRGTWNWNTPVK